MKKSLVKVNSQIQSNAYAHCQSLFHSSSAVTSTMTDLQDI